MACVCTHRQLTRPDESILGRGADNGLNFRMPSNMPISLSSTLSAPVFFVMLGARLVFDIQIFLDVLVQTIVHLVIRGTDFASRDFREINRSFYVA